MFLATTAEEDFWGKSKKILFLGEWCLLYPRSCNWAALDYEILDSPWNDREDFYGAFLLIDSLYEKLLSHLAHLLNKHHSVNYDVRYWRIVVGPWLLYALEVLYDRYVHIETAFSLYSELETIVLSEECFEQPLDTLDFVNYVIGDPYNLQLYSEIILLSGRSFPKQHRRDYPDSPQPKKCSRILPIGVLKDLEKKKDSKIHDHAPEVSKQNRQTKLALYQMDFSLTEINALSQFSRYQIAPLTIEPQDFKAAGRPLSAEREKLFTKLPSNTPFELLFDKWLVRNFPQIYFEGYAERRESAIQQSARVPRAIGSSTAWRFDEEFKFLAAEAHTNRKKIYAFQHGGAYGTFKAHSQERHELQISDHFFVWGWGNDDRESHLCNLPSPKLSALSSQIDSKGTRPNAFLYIATGQPRYPVGFHSSPVGNQWRDYFAWQGRFFNALPKDLQECFVYRQNPYEYGHYAGMRLADQFPEIYQENSTPILEALNTAELTVIDYSGATVFLEALAGNRPVLTFFDPFHWESRREAEPYVLALRNAGILFYSPEEAAAKVLEIQASPRDWWNSETVQTAKALFGKKYALSSERWLEEWGILGA